MKMETTEFRELLKDVRFHELLKDVQFIASYASVILENYDPEQTPTEKADWVENTRHGLARIQSITYRCMNAIDASA